MKELLKKYELELSDSELKIFEKFVDIFIEKNSQINLSAIRERDAVIEKHMIDSIMLNVFLELEGKVADMGTGGGFPLLPLAIVNPGVKFTGIDSVGKKLKAVEGFAQELGLNNVETLNGRAEELGHKIGVRDNFDYVVSRATAYFPTLLEFVIPMLKVGGIFVAYKLDDKEELKSGKKALIKLGAKIMKVKNYTIDDQKRTFVFIEKIKETNKKYPRLTGLPLSKPLK